MSNPNTPKARALVAALAKKNVRLGHAEALDVVAQLEGARNHQSSPAARPGAVSARALLAGKERIAREARLQGQVEELVAMRSLLADLRSEGMVSGVLTISREEGMIPGSLDCTCEATVAAPGLTTAETAERFAELADLDQLCAIAERQGFDFERFSAMEFDLGKFEAEWIRTAEKNLRKAGVILDL